MNENPLAPVGDMLLRAGVVAVASYAATTVKRIVEPSPVERFARDARRIVESFHRELAVARVRQLQIPFNKIESWKQVQHDAIAREIVGHTHSISEHVEDWPDGSQTMGKAPIDVPSTTKQLVELETMMLRRALAKRNGNQSAAARDVGAERKAFARRCKKLKVK